MNGSSNSFPSRTSTAGFEWRPAPDVIDWPTVMISVAARNPVVYTQVLRRTGDESVGRLLPEAPDSDLPRLLRYAEAADTPATRELLPQAYRKEGEGLFPNSTSRSPATA